MADGGEKQQDAQSKTKSTSMKGKTSDSGTRDSSDQRTDRRHETRLRSGAQIMGMAPDLGLSGSDWRHGTEPENRGNKNSGVRINEPRQVCDQKDSDAEIQRPRDVTTVRRTLPLKKRGLAVNWGERESEKTYVDIADRRHETDQRSTTDGWDTFSDWRPSECSDCPYYLRTGQCGLGIACHFNHPIHIPSVCKFCQRGFCKNGSYCKFVHPQDINWRYDEMRGSRTIPETRGITISDTREPDPRRRLVDNTPDSRDRAWRERSEDRSGENRVNGVSDSSLNGNGIQNASVPDVDDPDPNLKPSIDVDMSNQSVQPSPLVPNNNEESMKDTGTDEEFPEGTFDCRASENPIFDEGFDERWNYVPPVVEDIDPEVLAALPPEIREEVLAERRNVRRDQVDTDNATSGLLALQNLQPRTYEPPEVEDINPEFLAALSPDVREGYLRGGPVDPGFVHKLPALLSEENSYKIFSDGIDEYMSGLFALQKPQPRTYEPPAVEDIDPEFLAALPPEIRTEVLGQKRNVRGQPVATYDASVNTISPEYLQELPAHLREEILLGCSEADLQALPPHLLAEARMLRDRAMFHQQHQQEQRQKQNIERQRREAQENVQEQRESVEKLSFKERPENSGVNALGQENLQEQRQSDTKRHREEAAEAERKRKREPETAERENRQKLDEVPKTVEFNDGKGVEDELAKLSGKE